MSNGQSATSGKSGAGQGRLAQVIATRGGQAAPEAPFVIEHREALIYMLCEAAELEHAIMCQYLFAAFSLKQTADEGLSDSELDAVQRWRKQVSHIATQEMLHLALVHNLLSAIGAAPHMARPNLPAPASHYPAGVQLALMPFGEQALRHFMFLERPEGMDLEDADGLAAMDRADAVMSERDIVPKGQDFATVGHLYRSIETGFAHLVDKHGEDWLFVGPPRAQATQAYFSWPELVPVTDLASAQRAIDEILEQGEGPRGNWQDAHFGQFVRVLDEYQQMRAANPDFDPVRPVLAANVRRPERDVDVPLISDPLTARVTDLFNVGYEILLQIFERFFAHTEETDAQLATLADATIGLMLNVIKPLGDIITTLPVGEDHPGRTAGPSFELFYESDYLMPHRDAAWSLLAERLNEATWLCEALQSGRGAQLAGRLEPVRAAMRDISRTLAGHLPTSSSHARLAREEVSIEQSEVERLAAQARDLARASAAAQDSDGAARDLADLLDAAHSVAVVAASGHGCAPEQQSLILPRMVNSVLRPLADGIAVLAGAGKATAAGKAREAKAKGAGETTSVPGTPITTERTKAGEAPEFGARQVWDVAKAATGLRARLGRDGACPPELAEATAALQHLARELARPGEAGARLAELWDLQSGLPVTIQAERNGPYLVTNLPRLVDHLGLETRPAPQLALCRCGKSGIKPLCDGSHASNGFSDAKDPKRVTDRRDTYQGEQVTIFDNRGICQHSGLCSDRLATVFRTNADPFVAPSGGRLDEIIRAVRDCPSGALSYAISGVEARDQVDWADTRGPAIEVTKDGPYRITGRIGLVDGDGAEPARAEGASREHFALCRCGQSQNKPFCSGMHWYVDFRDPVPVHGHEPTLFEWAGGLPALTRVARLLYERHVPADPELAAAFANMPPDQPQRLARWVAAALGGPATSGSGQDLSQAGIGPPSGTLDDRQRSRWVTLAGLAADDAGLPTEPSFRSALASCVEWASRAVAAPDAVTAGGQAPSWDWGPGGPPSADEGAAGAESQQPDAPLPGEGEPVSFASHIKPLFREKDRQSMSFVFDLWSFDDVRAHASEILQRLSDGSMPCDGAWPAPRTEVFKRWVEAGTQP